QAPAGWRVWRFAAPGWPGPDALVRLVDERSRAAWRWAVALAVLVVGIAAGRLPAPTRAAGVAAPLAVALLAGTIPVARASEVPSGAIGGALAVLCFWLGQALPRRIRGAIWESQASTTSRAANLGAPLTLLVLVGFVASALSAPPELAGRDREPPILALFPYDGPPDPSRAPDRVLLRLEDYDRLRALAEESQSQAGPGVGIGALAASHRVAWQGDRDVLVESEFELSNDARSGSAEAWVFPVEGVRDVAATLDDVAVPVLVRPGGRSASVLVTGRGRHRLRVRRTATPRRGAAGLMLSLSINPVASARVAVAGSPSGERIEVPNARGRLDARDGGLDGALGPVGRLEARWLAAPGPGAQRVADAGAVDGLILWDAEPAGDHIRARLTYHNPEGTSVLRLALDPGLVVRPVVLPGLTDVTWEGTAEHLEWVASVDPPLPCDATVSLELWRPSPPTTAPTPTSGPCPADEPARRPMPRIEPLGVERFSGAVAFRRPTDWLGRLAADAIGGEAITDEAFVKAWGNLPDGPLTLSGTARFFRAPAPAPRTGPVPDRVCVQTRVQLDVGAGRVGMDLEADLAEVSGRSYRVELEAPADLRLVKVEADGLTDWSRTSSRIQLRFDGPPLRQRAVRIQGWMAAPSDPLTIGAPGQEIAAPWPKWVGVESRPGSLTIVAPARAQLVPAPGLTLLGTAPTGPGAESGTSTRYRIDQVEAPLRLRWEPEPPRVTVQVRSQMTVQPDWAEWVAVLRYDVTGGAIDAVPLKLPTAWATEAQVRVVGDAHQLTSETREATTFWMIRPEHPIWGTRRLVVRSTPRFERGETLAFPDLAPLRIGSARESRDTFLRVVNATGRDLSIEGSPGVQATDPRAMFRTEVFAGLAGLPANTYRVRAEGWSLKVQPQYDRRTPGVDEAGPLVSLADLRFTVARDGSTQGMARYEVEPRSGPFLPIELAGGAEPLWVAVNDLPTRPWREAPGRWLVPLEEGGASHVELIWRGPPVAAPTRTERPILLPSTGPARVPTLVTVRAPEDVTIRSLGRALEPIGPDQLELARAEWSARRIVETLGGLDRGSLRDRESLVSALVRLELRLRGAERAAFWSVAGPSPARDERARQVRARGRGIRASLTGAIETAALDEFAQAAQVHLGLARDTPCKPALEIPEPPAPVRACRLGLPRCFQGESGGRSRSPSFAATTVLPRGFLDRDEGWAMVLAALAAPVAIAALVRRARSMGHRGAAISLALILAAAAVSGPWPLAATLVMTALGLFAR
ncbi:MAG: hypothetical protein JOZ53_03920, partial [Planctomycetaceae bacterium]|nr:hypothetical protein [Planctomycetaceae bacterium]